MADRDAFRSRSNTTSTILGQGEIYTGDWEQNALEYVDIYCIADVVGTISIQFGTGPDKNTVSLGNQFDYTMSPNVAFAKTLPKRKLTWIRVVYTNGPGQQGSFQLITAFKDTRPASEGSQYVNITTATTTLVKGGTGTLDKVVFNKCVASGSVTLYDNTAASGTKIGTITFPLSLLATQIGMDFGVRFEKGLTVVTTGIMDITIVYS